MATLKIKKNGLQDQLSFNEGQKYCRMLPLEHSAILLTFIKLQGGHSAILLTFIKLPFFKKIFVLFIFEWLFYTGFAVISPESVAILFKH